MANPASRIIALTVASGLVLAPVAALAAPMTLTTTLAGANETAGGDPDGSGSFKVEMNPETNDFCYSLSTDKVAKATMVHLHSGAAGSDGPVIATLEVTGKDNDECIAIDQAKLDPIAAAPGDFYINVHTADFPKGAVRGQLAK